MPLDLTGVTFKAITPTSYPSGGPTVPGSKTGIGSTFTPSQVEQYKQSTSSGGQKPSTTYQLSGVKTPGASPLEALKLEAQGKPVNMPVFENTPQGIIAKGNWISEYTKRITSLTKPEDLQDQLARQKLEQAVNKSKELNDRIDSYNKQGKQLSREADALNKRASGIDLTNQQEVERFNASVADYQSKASQWESQAKQLTSESTSTQQQLSSANKYAQAIQLSRFDTTANYAPSVLPELQKEIIKGSVGVQTSTPTAQKFDGVKATYVAPKDTSYPSAPNLATKSENLQYARQELAKMGLASLAAGSILFPPSTIAASVGIPASLGVTATVYGTEGYVAGLLEPVAETGKLNPKEMLISGSIAGTIGLATAVGPTLLAKGYEKAKKVLPATYSKVKSLLSKTPEEALKQKLGNTFESIGTAKLTAKEQALIDKTLTEEAKEYLDDLLPEEKLKIKLGTSFESIGTTKLTAKEEKLIQDTLSKEAKEYLDDLLPEERLRLKLGTGFESIGMTKLTPEEQELIDITLLKQKLGTSFESIGTAKLTPEEEKLIQKTLAQQLKESISKEIPKAKIQPIEKPSLEFYPESTKDLGFFKPSFVKGSEVVLTTESRPISSEGAFVIKGEGKYLFKTQSKFRELLGLKPKVNIENIEYAFNVKQGIDIPNNLVIESTGLKNLTPGQELVLANQYGASFGVPKTLQGEPFGSTAKIVNEEALTELVNKKLTVSASLSGQTEFISEGYIDLIKEGKVIDRRILKDVSTALGKENPVVYVKPTSVFISPSETIPTKTSAKFGLTTTGEKTGESVVTSRLQENKFGVFGKFTQATEVEGVSVGTTGKVFPGEAKNVFDFGTVSVSKPVTKISDIIKPEIKNIGKPVSNVNVLGSASTATALQLEKPILDTSSKALTATKFQTGPIIAKSINDVYGLTVATTPLKTSFKAINPADYQIQNVLIGGAILGTTIIPTTQQKTINPTTTIKTTTQPLLQKTNIQLKDISTQKIKSPQTLAVTTLTQTLTTPTLKTIQGKATLTGFKQTVLETPIIKTTPIVVPKTTTTQTQKQVTTQLQKQITLQKQAQIQLVRNPAIITPREKIPRIKTPTQIPKLKQVPPQKRFLPTKKIQQAYDIEIRTKGTFKKVRKGLPKNIALQIGARIADITTARTFRLTPQGFTNIKDIKTTNLTRFREPFGKSKLKAPLTFIEKAKYAISSQTEKAGIPGKAKALRLSKASIF